MGQAPRRCDGAHRDLAVAKEARWGYGRVGAIVTTRYGRGSEGVGVAHGDVRWPRLSIVTLVGGVGVEYSAEFG